MQGIVRGRTCVEVDQGAHHDTVLTNELLLQQVLLNLATNSRDALRDGGHLRIATRSMDAGNSESGDNDTLILTVSDTGAGMSEETRQMALQPFFTTKSTGQGTGLGLPFVTHVIDQLGGRTNIDSAPGQGTTVTIELPVVPVQELADTLATTSTESVLQAANEQTFSILLVDDNPLVRQATKQLLQFTGMQVVTAGCGEDALQLLRGSYKFDVLISDYVMPGLNGLELAQHAIELLPELRVLLISGYQDEPINHKVLQSMGARLLSKPFQHDELLQAIHQCINHAKVIQSTLP